MGMSAWFVFGALSAVAMAWALYVYRRRELPGRGRIALAALRSGALVLLLLIAFDPELPGGERPAAARTPAVLVDASLSMNMRAAHGGTRWDQARQEAVRLAGGRSVLVFGTDVRTVPADRLDAITPESPSGRLLPALRVAAESGARRAVVLSDGAIEDAAEVARWLPGLGLELDVRVIRGRDEVNRALTEIDAPGWVEPGQPVELRIGVAGTAGVADSSTVRVLQNQRELGRGSVPPPAAGRVATTTLSVTPDPPDGGGYVRLDIVLDPADAVPDDDRRAVYVYVADHAAGVTLVSFSPDWEPRFLEPVLARALGLPVRGFLRLADGTYRATGVGVGVGAMALEEEVRRAAADAELLVLHGVDATSPVWARELPARHPRTLVLPGPAGGDIGLPVSPAAAEPGDWYAAATLPASPVAPLLAGLDPSDAPPLTAARELSPGPGQWVPVELTRGWQGAAVPALVAGETAGRRWVLAAGEGYWRWSFRGAAARQFYARMWGAVAGWLVRERHAADAAAVRPGSRAIERGGNLVWYSPDLAADSLAIRMTDAEGETVLDTTVLAGTGSSGTAHPAPAPGTYSYEAVAFADGRVAARGMGELTVESYAADFLRPALLEASVAQARAAIVPTRRTHGRPLRAAAWPYVLVLTMLAAEWVLRRRWGLR